MECIGSPTPKLEAQLWTTEKTLAPRPLERARFVAGSWPVRGRFVAGSWPVRGLGQPATLQRVS